MSTVYLVIPDDAMLEISQGQSENEQTRFSSYFTGVRLEKFLDAESAICSCCCNPSSTMAAEVARVVLRCEDAMETLQLDLSHCGLESFPLAVYHLVRNVTVLKCNLAHNKLKILDSKFPDNFGSITELNISHNEISKLPEKFNLFQELVHFDASNNRLNSMPPSLYGLEKLQTIDLCDNDISVLDVERLCSMPALKKVSLSGNPLNDEIQAQLVASAPKFELLLPVNEDNFSDVD